MAVSKPNADEIVHAILCCEQVSKGIVVAAKIEVFDFGKAMIA
jgi:hypothetical protein